MKHVRTIFLSVLAMAVVGGAAFATGTEETTGGAGEDTIVMSMSDNLPDRTKGWGEVVEQINDDFQQEHPNVEFVTESLPDQPYQEKIKVYATAGELPDVMKYWSFSTLLHPLAEAGHVQPLSMEDFQQYDWLPGALESNVYNGELYGIPVSADLWVIFYNERIFEEVVVEVPTTLAELKSVSTTLDEAGYIPLVTDGQDRWPLSITYDAIAQRVSGDFTLVQKALDREISFTDEPFVEAARIFQELAQSDVFQENVVTTGYGPARNLFGQERAAMYLMGSWELGLASDPDLPASFRENVRAMKFPVIAGGPAVRDDLVAWFGGNYIVNANSEHVDLGIEYLHTYAELYPQLAWEAQAGFPAQRVAASEDDTQLAKDLLEIAAEAVSTSGTTGLDLSTAAFKEDHQRLVQDLVAGVITPEEFTRQLDAAAERAASQ